MEEQGRTGVRGENFEGFKTQVSDQFVPLRMSTPNVESFDGRVRARAVGAIQLTEVAASHGMVQYRTPSLIRRHAPELLKVNIVRRGHCIFAQDGRQATLAMGDYVLYDTARPYEFRSAHGFQLYGVIIPRQHLRLPHRRLTHLTAQRFGRHDGLGSLVSAFLLQLGGSQLPVSRGAGSIHLGDTVVDMLTASFAERLSIVAELDPSAHKDLLLRQSRAFIEARLHDPTLDVATVAASSHISVRYLQKLFEEQGDTVSGWIRSRRLEGCRKDLASREFADKSVESIADRWGFTSPAYFSRVFKAVHGVTPSDYRAQLPTDVGDQPTGGCGVFPLNEIS